jgi:hypothetical protein
MDNIVSHYIFHGLREPFTLVAMQMSSKTSALIGQSLTSKCQREGNVKDEEWIIRVEYHAFCLGKQDKQLI